MNYLKKNGRKSLVLRMEKKICSLAVSLESNPCRP
jgi:hypothetical protein